MLQIFGGVSMRMGDFNKVAEQMCWVRTSALLFSNGFASCFQSTFLGEHLWRITSEQRSFDIFFIFTFHISLNGFRIYKIRGLELVKRQAFRKPFGSGCQRESFKLWILHIYVTPNLFLNLMMSFFIFPQCDCFRQIGFEQKKRLNLHARFLI